MSDNFPENKPDPFDNSEISGLSRQDQIKFAHERLLESYNTLNENIVRARALAGIQNQRDPITALFAKLTGRSNAERAELDHELIMNQKLLMEMLNPVMQSVSALEEVVRQQETLIQYMMSSLHELADSKEGRLENSQREPAEAIHRPDHTKLRSTLWIRLFKRFTTK